MGFGDGILDDGASIPRHYYVPPAPVTRPPPMEQVELARHGEDEYRFHARPLAHRCPKHGVVEPRRVRHVIDPEVADAVCPVCGEWLGKLGTKTLRKV